VRLAWDPQPQRSLTAEQRLLVETISKTMGLLLNGRVKAEEARQREALLRHRAETDELTGLANRRGWEQAIAEEEDALAAVGINAMVMMVDLDGLKAVNDTQGHAAAAFQAG
jgi:diguanylate cyclase